MKVFVAFATTALTLAAHDVLAAEIAMRRVLSCEGPDAKMEVYLPEAVVTGTGVQNVKFYKSITGAYSLDLTDAGKGKTLEPVRVSLSRDKKSVIVDQYLRKLPPTSIARSIALATQNRSADGATVSGYPSANAVRSAEGSAVA
jgi:hypothetical protein